MKPQHFQCSQCGRGWISVNANCPSGCTGTLSKSDGEFTKKTFQGDDNDLKKSGR